MSKHRWLAALVFLILAPGFGASAKADPVCKDMRSFIKDEMPGAAKVVDVFTFRRDRRGDNVLLLFKDTVEKGKTPKHWLFLNRPTPGMTDYCAAGRGEVFGYHDELSQNPYSDKFGPPGSGFPRCAKSSAKAAAGDLLRNWANDELGESILLYTQTAEKNGYQFVIATDQDWIIIEDKNDDDKTSCFYDRGTDVFMRFNFLIPPP